jgi:4-amino-4-deoxy-L-arabinose transferase-like glycosyltransferase
MPSETGFIRLFEKVENSGISTPALIAIIWSLLVVPAISIRGYHYEEDTVVALARGAAQEGHWLVPNFYGERFVERPVLMSWLVAAIASITGAMNEWVVRIPTVLSLLLGGVLVARLARGYASALGALFAALCFLLCPAILQRIVTAEPDVLYSVIEFSAFVVWWSGYARGKSSVSRWVAIGLILGLAGLAKGPQPLAFFFMGVAAFLALNQRWLDLLGLTLAGAVAGGMVLAWYLAVYQPGDMTHWVAHSRIGIPTTPGQYAFDTIHFFAQLALELLPASFVVVLFFAAGLKLKLPRGEPDLGNQLALALLLYASVCTVVLAFWPAGSNTRYAIPAIPAVATFAGIAFDRLRTVAPRWINFTLAALVCLAAYQLTIGWILMPNIPQFFSKSRTAGLRMANVMDTAPATLYALAGAANASPLAYIPTKVRLIGFEKLRDVPLPAWAVLTNTQLDALRSSHPELRAGVRLIMRDYDNTLLVHLDSASQPGNPAQN